MRKEEAENLLLALTGAYVWVASADSGADETEQLKFSHAILESPFATHFDEKDIRHIYKDTVQLFLDDFDQGIRLTREGIRMFKENPMAAEEFIRLARAALVADNKLEDAEENVLKLIREELGR